MWLIGREWKYSDVRSGPVLIDRGLDLSREPVLKESEMTRKTERIAYSESQEKRKTGNSRTERMKIRSRAANKAGRYVKELKTFSIQLSGHDPDKRIQWR